MKTTNLFKAVAFVAMVIVSIMNSEVKAQDRFITNEEVQNDLIVAKTIFRQSGTYLYNHMRYEFTYDDENRLTNKTASKWDSVKKNGCLISGCPISMPTMKSPYPTPAGTKSISLMIKM